MCCDWSVRTPVSSPQEVQCGQKQQQLVVVEGDALRGMQAVILEDHAQANSTSLWTPEELQGLSGAPAVDSCLSLFLTWVFAAVTSSTSPVAGRRPQGLGVDFFRL